MQATFDESTHTGAIDGRRVLSVTQVIDANGLYEGKEYFGDEHRILGRYVHDTTELYDKHLLDESSLDPVLAGYLQSWKEFRNATGFEPILIEERFFSQRLQFCGQLDRFGKMSDGKNYILDIKTGAPQPADCYQTAGYKVLFAESEYFKYLHTQIYRATVRLKRDGSMPSVKLHDKHSDVAEFMALLTAAQIKTRMKA